LPKFFGANISSNLLRTGRLARRLANSSWKDLPKTWRESDWIGEEFVDSLAAGAVDPVSGMPLAVPAAGSGAGCLMAVLLVVFVAGLILAIALLMKYPSFSNMDQVNDYPSEQRRDPPSQPTTIGPATAPRPTTTQTLAPNQPQQSDSYSVGKSDTTVGNSTQELPGYWEAALQRDRLRAAVNIDQYNQLIKEHLAIYRKRGVDPCGSHWFPQGCSH
jgi:hypothetical protein